MQRYFAKGTSEKIKLLDSDIYHIKKVMRMNIKDKIEVVLDGKLYLCEIEEMDPLQIRIIENICEDSKLKLDVTVAIGLVKEQKMDLILQKLTELGVNTIIPLAMERSIVKIDKERFAKKKVRWESICKEASEQAKRTCIPKIEDITTLKELVKREEKIKLVLSTKEKNKMLNYYLQKVKDCDRIIVVVGPEGGISEKEEEFLIDNGFASVSLGNLIFRVETAAIYIASIFNYYSSMR